VFRSFALVAALGQFRIQREGHLAATSLLGVVPLPFLGQKPLERHQQERAEPALVPIDCVEIVLFEQASEESLRQILRIMR
jgi:hypothetical protein